jgi:hypothetical protein
LNPSNGGIDVIAIIWIAEIIVLESADYTTGSSTIVDAIGNT